LGGRLLLGLLFTFASSGMPVAAEMPAAAAVTAAGFNECEECETQEEIPCSAVNPSSSLWGDDVKAYCNSHPAGQFTAHNFSTGVACESGDACNNCDGDCHKNWQMSTCGSSHPSCGLFASAIVLELADALAVGDFEFLAMAVLGITGIDLAADGRGIRVYDPCSDFLLPLDKAALAVVSHRLSGRPAALGNSVAD